MEMKLISFERKKKLKKLSKINEHQRGGKLQQLKETLPQT